MSQSLRIVFAVVLTFFIYQIGVSQQKFRTDFNSTEDLKNWEEFQLGKVGAVKWEVGSNGFNGSKCIIHNAPTGDANKDSLVNWYVSPKYNFSKGGAIDSLMFKYFCFMNTFFSEQFVGVYVLQGSNNPSLSDSIHLLADLSLHYTGDNDLWNDTFNLNIPELSGDCYIGFKFVAIDGWASISFDNLVVSSNATSSIKARNELTMLPIVYPNPASDWLNLSAYMEISQVQIFDQLGKLCKTYKGYPIERINVTELENGFYFLKIKKGNGSVHSNHFVKSR